MTTAVPTRTRVVRLLALLLGCFHLFGVGVVPAADARAERTALVADVHVESPDSKGCPEAHQHGECLLCRHVQHTGAPEILPDVVPIPPRLARVGPPSGDEVAPSATPYRPDAARAPPALA